jgi:hypothetical protein
MNIDDFAGTTPEFLPEDFLAGPLEGWGVLERRIGGVKRRFVVSARGAWDASAGRLAFTETWTFDDERTDTQLWTITRLEQGRYSGVEARIADEAEGEQAGCAFQWRYSRDTPLDDGTTMMLDFNNWFYLIEPRAAIFMGSAGRLSTPFAVVHITYRKLVESGAET